MAECALCVASLYNNGGKFSVKKSQFNTFTNTIWRNVVLLILLSQSRVYIDTCIS